MRYRKLGRTGLFVSELCLGTMTFGGNGGIWGQIGQLDQTEANRIVARSLEAGINFIDTANVYADGNSEIITGRALKELNVARQDVVIATKVFGATASKTINSRGNSRYHIMDAVKAVRALDDLVRQGHVRYVGVSNWAAWQIAKALGIAERLGLARFESLQAYYTIAGRDLERELVPMLESEGVGLLVWSPLAGGLLSGKYGRDSAGEAGSRRTSFDFPPVQRERAYDCIELMREIAEAREVSVAQVALAWLLKQKVVSTVIIGARRIEQLDDNIAATELSLSAEDLARLDAVSALPAEYPGWMFDFQGRERREQAEAAARLP